MAITLGVAATRITANAAAVATAMASGTTAAEAQALGKLLATLADRPSGSVWTAMRLNEDKQLTEKK